MHIERQNLALTVDEQIVSILVQLGKSLLISLPNTNDICIRFDRSYHSIDCASCHRRKKKFDYITLWYLFIGLWTLNQKNVTGHKFIRCWWMKMLQARQHRKCQKKNENENRNKKQNSRTYNDIKWPVTIIEMH